MPNRVDALVEDAQRLAAAAKEIVATSVDEQVRISTFPSLTGPLRIPQWEEDDLAQEKGLSIYDDMMKDATVRGNMRGKIQSLIGKEWELSSPIPEGDPGYKKAEGIATRTRRQLDALTDGQGFPLQKCLEHGMDALIKGRAFLELVWAVNASTLTWDLIALKPKDPAILSFHADEYGNLQGILYRIPGTATSELLDPTRFFAWVYQARYGAWQGDSDLRAAYKSWWIKQTLIKMWAIYLERYGAPIPKVSSPAADYEVRRRELERIVKSLIQDAGVVVPEGTTIELMETTKQAAADYKSGVLYHDTRIERAIWGFVPGSTEEESGADMVALATLQRHYELLFTRQVVDRIVGVNEGVIDPKLKPIFKLGDPMFRDLFKTAQALTQLVEKGVVGTDEAWLREWLGIPPRTGPMPAPPKPTTNPPKEATNG